MICDIFYEQNNLWFYFIFIVLLPIYIEFVDTAVKC